MIEVKGLCGTCRHRRQEPLTNWRCADCESGGPDCFEGTIDIAWYCEICEIYVPPDGYCHLYEPEAPI